MRPPAPASCLSEVLQGLRHRWLHSIQFFSSKYRQVVVSTSVPQIGFIWWDDDITLGYPGTIPKFGGHGYLQSIRLLPTKAKNCDSWQSPFLTIWHYLTSWNVTFSKTKRSSCFWSGILTSSFDEIFQNYSKSGFLVTDITIRPKCDVFLSRLLTVCAGFVQNGPKHTLGTFIKQRNIWSRGQENWKMSHETRLLLERFPKGQVPVSGGLQLQVFLAHSARYTIRDHFWDTLAKKLHVY